MKKHCRYGSIASTLFLTVFSCFMSVAVHAQIEVAEEKTTSPVEQHWRELVNLRSERANLTVKLKEFNQEPDLRRQKLDMMLEVEAVEARLAELQKTESFGYGQLSSLRGRVWQLSENHAVLTDRSMRRLLELEAEIVLWRERQTHWADIREKGFPHEEHEGMSTLLNEADSITEEAIQGLAELLRVTGESQREIDALEQRIRTILQTVDEVLVTIRKELFRRNSPMMFSGEFLGQLDHRLVRSVYEHVLSIDYRLDFFISEFGWILIIQLILIVLFLLAIRRRHEDSWLPEIWGYVRRRPWSNALFMVTLLFLPFYGHYPTVWRHIHWVILSVTSIRVLTTKMRTTWQKRLIKIILLPFVISSLFQIVEIPFPLFRLYIAAIVLSGIPFCLHLARWIERSDPDSRLVALSLKAGVLLLSFILLAQIIGFSTLANHLYEAAVKSVFLAAFSVLFLRAMQQALTASVKLLTYKGIVIVQKHEQIVTQRVLLFLQFIIAIIVVLLLTTIWGIFDTPKQAWQTITAIGVDLGHIHLTIGALFTAIVAIIGSFLLSRALQTFLADEIYPRNKIETGIGVSFNRLIHYGILVIAFLWALAIIGFRIENLTIIGGALGIGIGFGLQNIVSNFVSGLILLIEQPVKVGDIIVINDEWGQINQLGLRATIIETFDRSEIIIPNSELITGNVVNWTRKNRSARLKIKLGVAYGSNVIRVMQILQEVAMENPMTMRDPSPKVHFVTFGDSSLDFELWVWVSDLMNRLTLRTQLYQTIFLRFQDEGIEIPFPQRDIHIRSMVDHGDEKIQKPLPQSPEPSETAGGD